ncbi:Mus7/MMS22 family-domain-containing protein [Aspergillus egyptiacus]|nr:Mus7/MMS22 family-domain-containing protein [Aspergillus egyptiacus]
MQMESWRERGFVPDSDDEDAFESQERNGVIQEGKEPSDDGGIAIVRADIEHNGKGRDGLNTKEKHDVQDGGIESSGGRQDVANELEETVPSIQGDGVEMPLPGERSQTPEDNGGGNEPTLPESEPSGTDSKAHNAAENTLSSTPRSKPQRDIWDFPDSSPDLLQLDYHPWRKQTSPSSASTPTPKAKDASQCPQTGNIESSPSTSPLSSLHSLALEEDGQLEAENPPNQAVEDLLPPLDIPEEILRELDQPTRRSLRQRNPIQLHPYLLEDAKYQSLMRARGLKPVRVALNEQRAARADAENQGQEFGDDGTTASDTQSFQFPPSSPVDSRRLRGVGPIENPVEIENRPKPPREKSSMNSAGPRSPKRRRVIAPGDERQDQKLRLVRPQVVIDNVSSPILHDAPSIFDIPSPPRSGSVSSPPAQDNTGFRFPRGFEPPPITPRTETRKSTKDVNDTTTIVDEPSSGTLDDARSVRSASPQSHLTSESEEEGDVEEAVVRRLQKKIKGVLPASWLRLDQQKQKELQTAAQRRRERASKQEAEAAKGVARKITRKPDSFVPSSTRDQLSSLRQLADESDPEDNHESDKEGDNHDVVGSRQRLASLFGFEDSFVDQDPSGDIPEDNRIDYMFPAAPRNHTPHGRKPVKKRRRLDTDETHHGGPSKKPRLKRQARLTDPVYGSRRTKRSSQRLPKLGILDAPDVTSRPRNEQPQFLRIAARKARSRQDMGRHSPSRKVIRLNSRADTDDANTSLLEWRAGRLRQTTLPQTSTQHPRRRPLSDLSANTRDAHAPSTRRIEETMRIDVQQAYPIPNNSEENVLSTLPETRPETRNHGATKPAQQLRGKAWVVQRNLAISSLSRNNPRPVAPEIENRTGMAKTTPSLQGSLALLNRDRKLLLNRFLSGDAASPTAAQTSVDLDKPDGRPKPNAEPRRRQLKKRPPKRLDVANSEDQPPLTFFSPEIEDPEPTLRDHAPQSRDIGGLSGFKTTYSVDFDVSPLHPGIFFHESTFIGSGEFARSLHIAKRDLDKSTSVSNIRLGNQNLRWGAWDDNVSSQLGMVFDEIPGTAETGMAVGHSQEATLNGCTIYRSVIKYVTESLTFIDPIDRTGFATRANGLISKLMEDLANMVSATGPDKEQLIRIASFNVVFVNQVRQIACHNLVNQSVRDETIDLAKLASKQVITFISNSAGKAVIREFLAASKSRLQREAGIKDGYPVVDAYIIVQHVLRSADRFNGWLEDMMVEACSIQDANEIGKDISGLESEWERLFTTLPLQEIDARGFTQVGSRFKRGHDNWTVIKHLLRPVFDGEEANSAAKPISYYTYCRVLFQRCFLLINSWGWRDCKPILDTLYDFFAKRTLYNLKLEESYRSPSFLDDLDGNPSFAVLPGDPCFHILLKIIASGLRFLSKAYDKRKIRNYAWRLLPNHGRVYPKEQPIHQADLDALRNHHDLLCTLYSSVPDGCRPRLETIKNLVHPASSHHETCNISLRTWARLARFKMSTNEDTSGLDAFAEWIGYFATEFLKQHSLARREIEAQTDVKQFSQKLIDRTIAQNQRLIEDLLKTALQGLQGAIKSAPTIEHAQKIVSETPINSVLGLFNTHIYRLNSTVSEALQVIMLYVQKCNPAATGSSPRVESAATIVDEDSQEYGDWTDIEAVYGYEPAPVTAGVEHVERVFHPAVSRLVSNCFGEDRSPDDAILLSVVDCWTSIAHTLVRHGLRRWDSYIGPYEGDSWVALRWTTQTRKFTPEFLARCIEKDGQFLSECKMQVLGIWLSSLVERVSMIKYQHRLTEALLNQDDTDPVLRNLPFFRNSKEGRFSITYTDILQRRLSLISSVLSNMRVHIQDLDDADSRERSTTRHEYKEILQKMMSSMRSNYQELGGDAGVQGAYVDFVQRIVGFLQQHTRDICAIDPFFTDTATFPLPSTDPTYIVARLKSYEPKLSSANVAKSLTIFVQGVSERAALDGQQTYLVNQLHDSMVETYEAGNPDQPTLRATLLQSVFPAYLATAFYKPTAWILSRPIIETLSRVFDDLLYDIDTTDPSCVRSVLSIFSAVFDSSYKALHLISTNSNMLKQPSVLVTTTAFLQMMTSALPVIDYIDRLNHNTDATHAIITQLRAFQQLTLMTTFPLQNNPHQQPQVPLLEPLPIPTTLPYPAEMDLQSYLTENWSHHQGKYYFTKRGAHQPTEVELEISVRAKLDNDPERGLLDTAKRFLDAVDELDLFGEVEAEQDTAAGPVGIEELGWSSEELVLF